MVNKKFVSKVDEKLKAAEARRAELERAKAAEQEKKMAMRRERVVEAKKKEKTGVAGGSTTENSTEPSKPQVNVKLFKYLQFPDGQVVKIGGKKKRNGTVKLFTIKCIENLIKREEFDLAEVILGILKRSVRPSHPIQNKFARLHGSIVEIKTRNRRLNEAASGLNFTGSISPVRVPDFEADLDGLSRLSSPIIGVGMDEIAKKYDNIEELAVRVVQEPLYKRTEPTEISEEHFPDFPYDDNTFAYEEQPESREVRSKSENQTDQTNFPTVISPLKRPQRDIEAEVVYTPQRKSARRLNDDELIYDDDQVSQILLNDPNAAFISNPYIAMSPTKRNNAKK